MPLTQQSNIRRNLSIGEIPYTPYETIQHKKKHVCRRSPIPLTEKSNMRKNMSIGVPYAPYEIKKSNTRRNMSIGEFPYAPYAKNPK